MDISRRTAIQAISGVPGAFVLGGEAAGAEGDSVMQAAESAAHEPSRISSFDPRGGEPRQEIPGAKHWHDIRDGHFGLLYYPGEVFDEAIRVQAEFLRQHLRPL